MESLSSSGPKRRKLMVSYVSLRPDLPATFESLNDDTLTTTLQFVGNKCYRSFGGLNKHCKEIYLATKGMTKETFLFGYAPLSVIIDKVEELDWTFLEAVGKGVVLYNRSDVMKWALEERKSPLLIGICIVAGEEGRTDLLNEVWNNMNNEGDKRSIFQCVDGRATRGGKLKVLKWLEDKGVSINKENCAGVAAKYGQLHILQWLNKEKDVELNGELYGFAIDGGNHLHVMKWLKEKKVPWTENNFVLTAQKGNLNIFQWLHDEGCPWPDHCRVREHWLKPEMIDWCRSNGYGDRIQFD